MAGRPFRREIAEDRVGSSPGQERAAAAGAMGEHYEVRQATMDDVDIVLDLIAEAADWLRNEKTTTQWNRPWPSPEEHVKRVTEGVADNRTWIVWDGHIAVATVTIHRTGSPALWTPVELDTEAVYLHRLVVRRSYAGDGLGAELINWSGQQGRQENPDAEHIRIDVWTDNYELHDYYVRQGFGFVAVRETPDRRPSSRLFQKPLGQALSTCAPRLTPRPGGDLIPEKVSSFGRILVPVLFSLMILRVAPEFMLR
jgi:GNAT superfamily N-acetyltransferase